MLFNSLEFLIFLPIVFTIHWITPSKWRWIPLLIASCFFYMYWNPRLFFLIFFTMVVSYFCAIFLEKYNDKAKIKKFILVITIVSCLGVLIFFKYFTFLFNSVCDVIVLFGGKKPSGYFDIMLPVGISFYTFQTLSYVIDIYKGTGKAEKHFGYYALFVSFFPQLVAGPIERPTALLPQLRKNRHFKDIDYTGAFRYMLFGFFKKIAIADIIGIAVNNVYNNASQSTGLSALIATILFAVQIYCDFSGYSDIAVGCAKLFGVKLTENFKSPYSSKSIKEFWSRWHISLSGWLRDYIYFPLGGSRVKKPRWVLNIFVVFFVSGLWHGASYNFVIWGLLHAFFQVVGNFTHNSRDRLWAKLKVSPESKIIQYLRCLGTCALVCFAWIFFRANTLNDSGIIIAKIFSDYSFSKEYMDLSFGILSISLVSVLYTVVVLSLLPSTEKLKDFIYKDGITQKKIYILTALRFIIYLIMVWSIVCAWIYLQASDVGSSFIYFQF